MLDIGWPEMLVIAIVLIVVVGPKDLPKMLRAFGRTTSSMRKMAGDFRKQFDDALKEAELDELKTLANDARKLNPAAELKKAMNPLERAAQDVKSGLDSATKPGTKAGSTLATPGRSADKPASAPRPATPLKGGVTGKGASAVAKPAATAGKPVVDSSAKPASPQARPAAPAKAGATGKTTRAAKPANASPAKATKTTGKAAAAGAKTTAAAKAGGAKTAAKPAQPVDRDGTSKTKGAKTS